MFLIPLSSSKEGPKSKPRTRIGRRSKGKDERDGSSGGSGKTGARDEPSRVTVVGGGREVKGPGGRAAVSDGGEGEPGSESRPGPTDSTHLLVGVRRRVSPYLATLTRGSLIHSVVCNRSNG